MSNQYEELLQQHPNFRIRFDPEDGGYISDSSISLEVNDLERVMKEATLERRVQRYLEEESENFLLVGHIYHCAVPHPSTGKKYLQVKILPVYKNKEGLCYSVEHDSWDGSLTLIYVSESSRNFNLYNETLLATCRRDLKERKGCLSLPLLGRIFTRLQARQ